MGSNGIMLNSFRVYENNNVKTSGKRNLQAMGVTYTPAEASQAPTLCHIVYTRLPLRHEVSKRVQSPEAEGGMVE